MNKTDINEDLYELLKRCVNKNGLPVMDKQLFLSTTEKYGKEIFVDFLGQQSIPSEYVQRDRNSTIDLVPENMKEEFTSILKDATELYNSLPEFTIL